MKWWHSVIALLSSAVMLSGLFGVLSAEPAKPVWTWRCTEKPEDITAVLNMIYTSSAADAKVTTQTYSRSEGWMGTVWCVWYHQ